MSNVKSLWGGPTGEREVNQRAVETLENMLAKAKAGEVVGVVACALWHDGLSEYQIGGMVGGYSLIGALDVAKADLLDMVRE